MAQRAQLVRSPSTDNANQAGLQDYLFGQAAGLAEGDVTVFAALTVASLAVMALAYRPIKTTLFDPAFAGSLGLRVRSLELVMTALLVVAIVVGVRTVGALLMVAMIVVPAAVARQFTVRLATLLPLAGAVGGGVAVAGSLVSMSAQAPTGPVIVLVGLAAVLASLAFAPRRGVVWRARKLRRDRRRVLVEGVLVDLETALHAGPPPTTRELAAGTGRPLRALRRAVGDLDRAGLIAREGERLYLSEAGAAAAHSVLERRELWWAWLEHGSQLGLDNAREPDPSDLRASLGDEAADRLRALATKEAS